MCPARYDEGMGSEATSAVVAIEERAGRLLQLSSRSRQRDGLAEQVVQQERDVEHRIAEVGDLPVDDPQSAVAGEYVLG